MSPYDFYQTPKPANWWPTVICGSLASIVIVIALIGVACIAGVF